MQVTMFNCRACGDSRMEYIEIGVRVELDLTSLEIARDNDIPAIAAATLYDAGVSELPQRYPVFANGTDHEPAGYELDPDNGSFLRGCINCGTVRMMTRDER
jgi:hypothetical protein